MSPAVLALQEHMNTRERVEGKVIGWNKGGFHVVCEGVTAFCPNSEMEPGKVHAPKDYLDQVYDFSVLRIEDSGRRVVLSRSKAIHGKRSEKRAVAREKVQVGAEVTGKIASLTNFGAFVELGGVQGLVHVSEISRQRVEDPASVLSVGEEVKVKVLKVEQGGKRISLSMKALLPDPWRGVAERYPEGTVVDAKVERTASFGAFIQIEPGLTGLLPASVMNLPRDASINRMYSPGKELKVMVMSVDPRRRRISLALEGSQTEGSRSDFEKYKKQANEEAEAAGFNAMAAAFQKIKGS
jgi:small subunit ribosomal protein S1